MIICLSQCQQHCSGTAQVSRVVRFVRYLCQVVLIRARMKPICRIGCQPSPSSQQVFCAVLCVTVSARLVLGEVADCFEFAQYTEYSSAQLSWTNAYTQTEAYHTNVMHKNTHMHSRVHIWKLTHTFLAWKVADRMDLQVTSLSHLSQPDNVLSHWSHTSSSDNDIAKYYIPNPWTHVKTSLR